MIRKKIVIVGGGTGGIAMAARLKRAPYPFDITIIEPSATHYYQPIFTLVGAGDFPYHKSYRPMSSLIPRGVQWVQKRVAAVEPESHQVKTEDGMTESYDYLILAPGIVLNWQGIEGLSEEVLGEAGVCSNYSAKRVMKTWEILQGFKGGNAIFTYPQNPIKCGGAPQKIMWLAQHYLELHHHLGQTQITFATPGKSIFGVAHYRPILEKLVQERNIQTLFEHELVKVDLGQKVATFRQVETGAEKQMSWEMIHITPPMTAPAFIGTSGLGDPKGWIDVDPLTARHKSFSNIFGIGDASNLPTGKTGAAIRKQVPVVVDRILSDLTGRHPQLIYNGYTSCPVVTGYNRLVLAEFDYNGYPVETFPFDQAKERRSMYWLKKYGLPFLYWYGMMKGWA